MQKMVVLHPKMYPYQVTVLIQVSFYAKEATMRNIVLLSKLAKVPLAVSKLHLEDPIGEWYVLK